jgi:MoaA/NifB/PqqE/SkfB family radical SAM enzyme
VHCKQWTWPGRNEFSVDQLYRLFCKFSTWGVQTVTFGGGNPLVHAHICTALRMAYEKDLQIGIISEGVALTDELADAICQYARWIRFSLDAPRPAIHDTIRNKSGLFDLVIQNIRSLKSRQSALRLGLNCVVQKANLYCLSEMIDLGQRLALDAVLFKIPHGDDPTGRYLLSADQWKTFTAWVHHAEQRDTGALQINLRQLISLIGTVFKDEDVLQGRPVKSFFMQEQVHCFAPLFFLTCDSEGNMYPCDYLQADTRLWGGKYERMRNEFCLGNVLHDSQKVLENLAEMLRHRVHGLPASGYDECGCCTRFCQLNASLTNLHRRPQGSQVDEHRLVDALGCRPGGPEDSQFL